MAVFENNTKREGLEGETVHCCFVVVVAVYHTGSGKKISMCRSLPAQPIRISSSSSYPLFHHRISSSIIKKHTDALPESREYNNMNMTI